MTCNDKGEGAKNRHADEEGKGDEHDGQPIGCQNCGIHEHAHRHKEYCAKEVAHGVYQFFDALCLDGFCQDATHDESSKSGTKSCLSSEHHQTEAQTDAHDQKNLRIDDFAVLLEEIGYNVDAHHKPQYEENSKTRQTGEQRTPTACGSIGGGSDRAQQNHEQDAEDVFQNQHRKHLLCKSSAQPPKVVQRFVNDGGGRNTEDSA